MNTKQDDLLSQRTKIILQQMNSNPQGLNLEKSTVNSFFEIIKKGEFLDWFAKTGADLCFPFEALMYALENTHHFLKFQNTLNSDCIFLKENVE